LKIRNANPEDLPFLGKMLFEAFFWDPETARPEFQTFVTHPEFRKLLSDWGRPGDNAVIAEVGEIPVGAAWYRFWTLDNHSYGFVDSDTPEIGIGVDPRHRSKGVGRLLLRALIGEARKEGIRSISLSVDPSNYAHQLYTDEGFVKVGESGTSCTMVLRL
jgi:ribosomal protein S18 acetylase RimI-like enzyme